MSPVRFSRVSLLTAFCSMVMGSGLHAGWVDDSGGNWDWQNGVGPNFAIDITAGGPLNVVVASTVSGAGPQGTYGLSLGGPSFTRWLQTDQVAAVDFDGKVRLQINADHHQAFEFNNAGTNTFDMDAAGILMVHSDSTAASTSATGVMSLNPASVLDLNTLAGQIYVSSDNTTASYTNLRGIYSRHSIVADEIASTALISVDGPGGINRGIETNLGDITIGPGGSGNMAGRIVINGRRDGESESDHLARIANTSNASGMHTVKNVTIHGTLSGSIEVNTGLSGTSSNAYGIYASEAVNIGMFAESGLIEVNGQGNRVVGINALGDLHIHNELAGDILINTAGGDARGLFSDANLTIGSFSDTGLIDVVGSAEFGSGQVVAGIDGRVVEITGEMAGDITVENTLAAGYRTHGIYSGGDLTIGSVASTSRIDVTSPGRETQGLMALGSVIVAGNMDGEIIINGKRVGESDADHAARIAGSNTVMGIWARVNVDMQDALNGRIEVHAGHVSDSSYARGIFADGDVTIDSVGSTGGIIVRGDGWGANGIEAYDGVTITNEMAGTIDVIGRQGAYGIAVNGSDGINLGNVTGTISAVSTDPTYVGFALYSGAADADDSVTLSTGANIVGEIAFNGETTEDVLTLRGNGTFSDNLYDVERLVVSQDTGTGSTKDEVWHLSLADSYDETFERNMFDSIEVNYGMLGVGQTIKTDTLTVEADGGLYYRLNSDGSSNTIEAASATLKEGATIKADLDGPITGLKTYTLIDTTGGVTIDASGDVADLIYIPNTALIEFESELSIDGNDLIITASAFEELQTYADTPAKQAAESLQRAFDEDATGDAGDVLAAFQSMSEEELVEELDKISPEQSVASVNAAADTSSSFAKTLTVRTQAVGSSALASAGDEGIYAMMFSGPSMRDEDGYEFWTSGFGTLTEQDDKDGIVGYTSRAAGTLVGLDRMSEDVLMGVAFGFAHADIDANQSRGSTDLDAMMFGGYFAYAPSNWKIEGGSVYTMGLADYKRETSLGRTAEADDVMSHTFTNYVGASYDFTSADGRLVLIPNAQLTYTYFRQESYGESKAGALNLDVDSFDNDMLTAMVGMKAEYAYSEQLKINSLFAYKRDLVNDAVVVESSFQSVGSTPFKTSGIEADKNAIEIGAGVDYQVNDRMKASVDYSYEHRESLKTQNVTVGLNILF
ncbi:Outer membrane protein B precursor [Poriferisphaera corsica]|uniref:Outer membrane protein B n=1 Tax=Poriferisphaera corsica TaxID=2528020 RepID=A0A517YQX9_9BACT|nr:autotransporter outer membrane beta-barrel domain-containing protein [Poriferisphaera corsica]QDU32642.1 Outer membrane protein B precursor [Poriferisphaera corsica]